MKIRILNGGHAVIAYPGGLMDIHFVHEAMQEPLISGFLEKIAREEIIPVVPPVPDTDLSDYFALIERRFANPKIGDTIRRLCLDGSNRQPKFIVPSIADNLARGGSVKGLALESALWCRYCYGLTDSGAEIAPNDPSWDRLQAQSRKAKDNPTAWLEMADIYGDTARAEPFRTAFADWLSALWSDGTRTVLTRYLGG
jgi:mannitol 2-dehydrogenase